MPNAPSPSGALYLSLTLTLSALKALLVERPVKH
jgi:hypothetical protein